MSLSDTITLNNAAAVPKTFVLTTRDGQSTLRLETTSLSDQPRTLAFKHSKSGSRQKGNATDRHLMSYTDAVVDGLGQDQPIVVNLTISAPQSSAATRAKIDDGLAFLKNQLNSVGFVDAFLRGES